MLIPAEDVPRVWGLVEPHLAKAFALSPKITSDSALEACMNERSQLWLIWAPEDLAANGERGVVLGGVLTDLCVYESDLKACRVIGCGGVEFERWGRKALEMIEKWALWEECTVVEMIGRKGWGRVFPDYAPVETTYAKEIAYG
jgi:hypothetical protein